MQLRIQVLRRQSGTYYQHRARGTNTGDNFRLQPVNLLLILVGIGHIHAVIHDDKVGTGTVHVASDTQGLYSGVFLARVTGRVRDVDHVLIPRLRILIEATRGAVGVNHLLIAGMRKSRLDRVQHLLSHLRRLRD